jgi:hypothetical protein
MNSIPQHEVAKGSGHNEFIRANPIALSNRVAKKPLPERPSGMSTIVILLLFESIDYAFCSPSG